MKKIYIAIHLISLVQILFAAPVNLKVNYLKNPVGIDSKVHFSWELDDLDRGAKQTAYRLLVASSPENLRKNLGDCWDSKKIVSSETLQIEYRGKTLSPASRYYWKIISWNQSDILKENNAVFETGLFSENDWEGEWIYDGTNIPDKDEDFYKNIPAPLFRKGFSTDKKIAKARLYIAGLGYNEVYLNGQKISDYRLEPGWTQFAKTVYYNVHDVTEKIVQGKNALGVILGNGWYNPLPLRLFGNWNLREYLTIGQPKLRCQLQIEYEDGTSEIIASNESWKTCESPIIRNNVYLGEWYDARMEKKDWCLPHFDDSKWLRAKTIEGPKGKLTWQYIPPIRLTRPVIKPIRLQESNKGIYVFDLGQNFAGVIRFVLQASEGDEIIFRYAEIQNDDYSIDVNSSVACHIKSPGKGGPGAPDVAWQEDRYISKGNGVEVFEPRFTFHGFRYVEVSGLSYKPSLNDLEGIPLNSDIEDVSEFTCSNELFNKIQQLTEWAMLSNVFSIESDCPAREKFGYGGDMVAVGETYMYNYDMTTFYQKTVRDFENDALPNGAMTECAPNIGINERGIEPGTGSIGWTLAHPFVLYHLYKYYGNLEIVREQYPALKKLVDFYDKRTPGFLILDCIGDHNSVDERPRPVSAASAYYHHVQILVELAKLLGKKEDVQKYSALAENIKNAFIQKLVDAETGKVYSGFQASQVFALYYDLLPDTLRKRAFQKLENQIVSERQGHLSTGIFSTKMMLNYLSDQNRDDLSYIMLNQKEFPGYGYMIDNGATTLWEHWEIRNQASKNHPMFGSVSEWFYRSVLGIQQTKESIAFSEIIIKPSVVGDLTWAKGSYHSVRGKIKSYWWKFEDDLHLEITIPANTTAFVYIPVFNSNKPDIWEGNTRLVEKGIRTDDKAESVQFNGIKDGFAVCSVKSGRYSFIVRN